MALNIKNPTAERLAHELADATGVSLTDAVIGALQIRLDTLQRLSKRNSISAGVAELQAFVRAQPDRDPRGADEILGYDAFGLPV